VRRLEIAQATLTEARARVSAAQAEIERALEQRGRDDDNNATLKTALSAVDKAALDLDNTVVRAPSGGVITDLRADVGQFAGTGSPVVTLIAIHDVWIAAEFTENNLAHIKPGSSAEIVFDVLPGRVYPGKVRSIGIGISAGQAPAAGTLPTIQNNRDWLRQAQRFPVVIEFDAAGGELRNYLRVGGQAEVIVYSDKHPLIRRLGAAFIRGMSWLSYAY
jgi:multidrug resistance efflux pump